LGIVDLPLLPQQKIPNFLFSQSNIDQRRKDLENYLRLLVESKETRHTQSVISFLELDEFCPEYIYTSPKLLKQTQVPKHFYCSRSLIIPEMDLIVIALVDKRNK